MSYEKYYKIKAQCFVCNNYTLQLTPKEICVGIRTICKLDPKKDLSEIQFCEKFEPCDLLDYL